MKNAEGFKFMKAPAPGRIGVPQPATSDYKPREQEQQPPFSHLGASFSGSSQQKHYRVKAPSHI